MSHVSTASRLPRFARLALTTFAAVLCASFAFGRASTARAEVIERIVAVVNDEAIFLSELRTRAMPFLPRLMEAPEHQRETALRELYGQLLEHLVDEKLIEHAADEMRIRVMNDDVERAIRNVQMQHGVDGDEFWEAVRAQGFTESQYRSDLRRQILRLKVIHQRVRGRVNITEEDVRRQYERQIQGSAAGEQLRFHVAHVYFQLPDGANASQVAETRRLAATVQDSLTPENFEAAIDQHGGGDLGWLRQGDLPQTLETALLRLQPGQISEPVLGPNGVHVFFLRDRELGNSGVPTYEEAKEALFRQMMDQAMARQEQLFLQELRDDAVIVRRL